MDILYNILGFACFAVAFGVYIAPAAWAVGDAKKHGQAGGVIVLLFWLLGPLSALIWMGIRPSERMVDRKPEEYTNADDALAAAASLDQIGEWDAAIALYEETVTRWPEHDAYIAASIRQIKEKQSLA